MTEHDIERMMQCVTCGCDIDKCREADEDEKGMCTKWVEREEE